jgi:alpha-D-xyloside xylohydrolase
VPWQYDDEAVDVLRFFTNLKCRIMPYLYELARDAHRTGVPLMRAMMLEFPDDPACALLDRQYMLGDSLLVAPVFSADNTVEYYVPAGTWTNFITGKEVKGPRWVRESHGFLSLPLLARPGSVIPVGASDQRPDYDYADGVEFRVFAPTDNMDVTVAVSAPGSSSSAQMTVRNTPDGLTLHMTGTASPWTAILVGATDEDKWTAVSGGSLRACDIGIRITPATPDETVCIARK